MSTFKQTNKESTIFLYEQIKLDIKDMIAKEIIKRGDKLPSEKDLCDHFNASRITIRRALKELESEDIIEVIHGKGTFAKGCKRPIHILNLKGFTEGLSATENHHFTKKVITKEIITADEYLMEKFNRDSPFKIIKLVRVIKDEHDVFSVDFAYLPCDIYPNILPKIEDNVSTFKIMREYGIKFQHATKEIEASLPTTEISKLFNTSNSDPVIKVTKLIKDSKNDPVHFSEYYLLGRRVSLYMDVEIEGE